MHAPSFWWRRPGALSAALSPLAAIYGTVAGRRMAQPGARAPLPCICIGNFVAGGAGKTPTAIAVAGRLRTLGRSPILLSRGYGGRLRGPLVVDPKRHGWRDVGDEALLLAAAAPTVVSRDRVAGARLASSLGDVLVLDDGFQNPSLEKDLSIVVLDGEQGIGNGRVIPAGPLRAPLGMQAERADAILVVGEGPGRVLAESLGRPLLTARLRPDEHDAHGFRGRRVLAFCGIGRPEKFFTTLSEIGAVVAEERRFADHHRFSDRDAQALLDAAERIGADLVTTAKDAARLAGSPVLLRLAAATKILRADLVLQDDRALDCLLTQALRRRAA